jgi:tetratricopeptide (TPR) repeat protein
MSKPVGPISACIVLLLSLLTLTMASAEEAPPLIPHDDGITEERLQGESRPSPELQPVPEIQPSAGPAPVPGPAPSGGAEAAPGPESPSGAATTPGPEASSKPEPLPGSEASPDNASEPAETLEPAAAQEPASPPNSLDELARLRDALHVDPDGQEARLRLANLLYQMGDSEAAIDEYRTLLRFHPDAALGHLGLGIALMAKQEWKTALGELQEAARLDPGLVQPHFSMGTIHYTRGSPLAAAKSYREALRLKPDFAEAHYRLGLVLKMAGQDKEAVQEFETAALSGIAKAQLFLGNAYRSGYGVEKSQVMAITWWSRAFEQGLPEAAQALAQLRRLAAVRQTTPTKQAKAAAESFQEFCNQLWLDFPDLEREHPDDTVGVTLLKHGRTGEALPVLLREAYALNERSHAELVRLYEEGLDGQLPKHGQWILTFLESTAADGARTSRVALARIYGLGLGVEPDMAKAKAFLKGLPKDEAKALLDDITAVASQS